MSLSLVPRTRTVRYSTNANAVRLVEKGKAHISGSRRASYSFSHSILYGVTAQIIVLLRSESIVFCFFLFEKEENTKLQTRILHMVLGYLNVNFTPSCLEIYKIIVPPPISHGLFASPLRPTSRQRLSFEAIE